jgi:hypothetical protein
MRERRAVIGAIAKRYQRATKKQRGVILDEFTRTTGYSRKHAAWVLTNELRKKVFTIGGRRTIFVFGLKESKPKGKNAPSRPATYGADIARLLKQLWAITGGLCGKRLAPCMRDVVPVLERFEELPGLTREQRQKLLKVSPATIDRLLAPQRAKYQLKDRSTTRPGSLLKHQIPIRTYSDWDEAKPGFMEADLVAQDGGEFINEELFLYCQSEHVTFTRNRA